MITPRLMLSKQIWHSHFFIDFWRDSELGFGRCRIRIRTCRIGIRTFPPPHPLLGSLNKIFYLVSWEGVWGIGWLGNRHVKITVAYPRTRGSLRSPRVRGKLLFKTGSGKSARSALVEVEPCIQVPNGGLVLGTSGNLTTSFRHQKALHQWKKSRIW